MVQDSFDLFDLLSSDRAKKVLENGLKEKLLRKFLILKTFLLGKTSIYRTFWSLVPGRLRPSKIIQTVRDLDAEIISKLLIREIYQDFFNVLGKNIYFLSEGEIVKDRKYENFLTLASLIREVMVKDQYSIKKESGKDLIVIDAGANIGIFSIFANNIMPNAQIYSFEPVRQNFNLLERNIKNNNLENNIHIFNLGLGDESLDKEIMISQDPLGVSSTIKDSLFFENNKKRFFQSSKISITTIDEFVRKNSIKKVDFIKIDTEGYERQILEGAKETIKRFYPKIACCAYHLQDDETKIPEFILSIAPDYEFQTINNGEKVIIAQKRLVSK